MALRTLALVLALAAPLLAHGGMYRGGTSAPFSLRPAVVPGLVPAPGAAMPGVTPGRGTEDLGSTVEWSRWWEFNKDPFLQSRGLAQQLGPVTGSDDFYLGTRRPADRIDSLLTTDKDREERIAPRLAALLAAERNRDVQSACLIGLGKVGVNPPGIELEALLAQSISRDDQEVRESAVLALGLTGRSKVLAMLVSLLADEPAGRALEQRDAVSDRTRAFAAYGLGILAMRNRDLQVRKTAQQHLLAALRARGEKDRDVRAAALSGLGLLSLDVKVPAEKLLLWQTVESLLAYHSEELGAGDEPIQAHASVAIARLLGRGASTLHDRCKQQFAAELDARQRRGHAILQSSALALGMLCEPTDAHSHTLQKFFETGTDRLARCFAAIALGRIGGEANRTWLLRTYDRSGRATERPWLALALGMWCACGTEELRRDETIALRLVADLKDCPSRDTQSALAIAVGLTKHEAGSRALNDLFVASENEERSAGHLAIGLALLGDRVATTTLLAVMERSERRPFLLQQTALALGVLGDRQAVMQLVLKLKNADSVAVLAALAKAIGQIGDQRAIEPLLVGLNDDEAPKLRLAFLAAALGSVGDREYLPWNLRLSVDANYATDIDTLTNGATGVLDIL